MKQPSNLEVLEAMKNRKTVRATKKNKSFGNNSSRPATMLDAALEVIASGKHISWTVPIDR